MKSKKIALVGYLADSEFDHCGSYFNAGANVVTVKAAMEAAGLGMTYSVGANTDDTNQSMIPEAVAAAGDGAVHVAAAAADEASQQQPLPKRVVVSPCFRSGGVARAQWRGAGSRIKREFEMATRTGTRDVQSRGFWFWRPVPDDHSCVRFACCGPSGDTPYAAGVYVFNLDFPEDYPMSPPDVTLLTPVRHCNVAHGAAMPHHARARHRYCCKSCASRPLDHVVALSPY